MKTDNCQNILKYFLNLSDTDLLILKKYKGMDVKAERITEDVGKDRSTICRSLSKIMDCGMATKTKINIEKGGYYYIYHIQDKDVLKDIMKKCSNKLVKKMEKAIKEIDSEF